MNCSNSDIIHLHWFQHDMLSISDISKIKKPLVWTFHDMWPFCGAEHISYDQRWKEGYFKSNRPNTESGFDLNRWTWNRKKKYWTKPIQIIAPSKWMMNNVKKSYLMKNWPVTVIPNPININIWKPVEKKIARDFFNLPRNFKLILFGSPSGTKDYNKGFDLLKDSIKHLEKINKKENIALVIFGESKPKDEPKFKFPVYYLGYLSDQISLKSIYSSVDVVVIPSRIESFGQIASESNSCGTPVVAFKTSGLKTTIVNKITGYLAEPYNTLELSKGIIWVLKNNCLEMKKNCIDHVVKNYNYNKIGFEHYKLYKKILKK